MLSDTIVIGIVFIISIPNCCSDNHHDFINFASCNLIKFKVVYINLDFLHIQCYLRITILFLPF